MEYASSNLDFEHQTQSNLLDSGRKKYDHLKGLSMVLLGAILWGVSGTAAQELFQRSGVHPGWLVTVRMSVAGLLLLAAVSMKSGATRTFAVWRDKSAVVQLVLFATVGLLGVQYSYFASIRYGNAAAGTLLQYLGPIFIMLYVALRDKRMPSITQFLTVVFALIGALLLVTNGDLHRFSVRPAAVVWGLISALTLAFYSLYPIQLLKQYGAASVSGWGMLMGGIAMGFASPPWHFAGQSSPFTWGLVSFVVIFGTLIAFYVYIASLKYISPAEASLLACSEPLSATIIAVACLHVQMGFAAILGGLFIVLTVTIQGFTG